MFREVALSLPDAEESSHMEHPDFRVRGKIFATLAHPKKGFAMVKLTPFQQDVLVRSKPDVFAPVPGGWGKRGATYVTLSAATKPQLRDALVIAWKNTAPKSLVKQFEE